MPTQALRHRSGSSRAPVALVVVQVLTVVVYGYWMLASGPSHSHLQSTIEYYSFFVMPFIWIGLVVAGFRMLRRTSMTIDRVLLKVGTGLSLVPCVLSLLLGAVFGIATLGEIVTGI